MVYGRVGDCKTALIKNFKEGIDFKETKKEIRISKSEIV